MRAVFCRLALASLGVSICCEAGAQEMASEARSFDPPFFAPFNPVTAEDMVRRVPGFNIDDGQARRGFGGTAGNVLINGERPASKAPISEQLARISARDVLRIDLRAGGGDSSAAAGQTMFVDVRLRPRQAGATNTFVASLSVLDPSGSMNPVLGATSAFRAGDVDFTLALQAQPARRGRIEFDKLLATGAGSPIEQAEEFLQGDYWEYRLSGRGVWRPTPDDRVTFNAQVVPSQDGRHTFAEVRNPAGALIRVEDSSVVGDKVHSAEIGGDWERQLSRTASLRLVALASEARTGSSERFSVLPAAGARRDTFVERGSRSGEYIARGVGAYRAGGGHTIELGGEVAFNFRDSQLEIQVDTGSGPRPALVPLANTRVEEVRSELRLSDRWRLDDRFSLDASVAVEASTIEQSGDASQKRDFTYFKPRLQAVWRADAAGQWRVLLERDVAQLDFAEFASAVSLFDGTVDVGNPNLEPERTLRAQLEWERRLGPKSALTIAVFHDEVEAVQDQIPFTSSAAQFDGPGNLGDGTRDGLRLNATAPLDALGLQGGEMRFTGMVQKTRVTDPVTHRERRFSDEPDWSYSLDLRQPLPRYKLLWGTLIEDADAAYLYRLGELRSTGFVEPHVDLYAETTAIAPFVVRFTVSDVLRPRERRERLFFTPNRTAASASSIETRQATGGYGTRTFAIRVSGRF